MDPNNDSTDLSDGGSSPSHDLADLSVGAVMFVAGVFLLLEIGGALVMSGTLLPRIAESGLSRTLLIEAGVVMVEIALITLLLALERVHPWAAGLRFRDVPRGLMLGIIIWALCQLSLATVSLGRHGSMSLYAGWIEPAGMIAPVLRRFLTEVFAEEMFWRGILFIWLLRKLEVSRWKEPVSRLGVALLGSQLLFGITRLPALLLDGSPRMIPPGPALVVFMLTGMFYALIYLRTRNLWLVMAVHALSLWPLPIFAFDVDPSKVVVLISAVLLIPTKWGFTAQPVSPRAAAEGPTRTP